MAKYIADTWIKFYPERFMDGSKYFNLLQKGAYITLLIQQHNDGFIPNDKQAISNLVFPLKGKELDAVLSKFDLSADGNLRNKKMENVLNERNQRSFKNSQNGIKGNKIKYNKPYKTVANATQNEVNNVANASKNITKTVANAVADSITKVIQIDNTKVLSDKDTSVSLSPTPDLFVPPTVEEVVSNMEIAATKLFFQKKLGAAEIEAQALRFVNYYTSVGWRKNNQPIVKWQPLAYNWLQNDFTKPNEPSKPINNIEKKLHKANQAIQNV
jgi:hypothetical protein